MTDSSARSHNDNTAIRPPALVTEPLWSRPTALPDVATIPSLSDYHHRCHSHLTTITQSQSLRQPLCVVMGNESSDYDSTVSASVLAYYLSLTQPLPQVTFLPIINVPRRYFHLRAEIQWSMEQLGVEWHRMIFIDDFPLDSIAKSNPRNFYVILTDHNRLAPHQTWMGPHVIGTVDHHADERLYSDLDVNRRVWKTGSCCAHVTNIINEHLPALWTSNYHLYTITQLLVNVILLDTHNVNMTLQKATSDDIKAMDRLVLAQHSLQYTELKSRRSNVSGWSTEDLLLKDSKVYNVNNYIVQISTVPQQLDEWQRANPKMIEELAALSKQYDALIVLTSFTSSATKQYKRELLLIVHNDENRAQALFDNMAKGLETDPTLSLKPVDTSRPVSGSETLSPAITGVSAVQIGGDALKEAHPHSVLSRRYDQLNVSSSRKQVAPRVEELLSKL